MERNFEVNCLENRLASRRQFCEELQHTLQSLIESCPLGLNEGVQLIEDYAMQVKHKRQYICFGSDVHFQAFAFVGGQHPFFSLCPSPDAFVIAAVSKRFQLQMQAHFSEPEDSCSLPDVSFECSIIAPDSVSASSDESSSERYECECCGCC